MRTFRAYLLNPAGRITWGEWIEAQSLDEAEAIARTMCDAGTPTVELWEGARRLSDVPCAEDQPVERTKDAV